MVTNEGLAYAVFVSDPIPMHVPGHIPNGESHTFAPLATTLIYGQVHAVLAEAPLTIMQAEAVGDWVEAIGKDLTHIYASHGHGGHWFTADVLARRFDAQVVASAGTIAQMHAHAAVRHEFWDQLWPGQIPPSPVTATTPAGNRFTLEGHDIVITDVGHADTDDHSVLHVPDLGLVVAGDALYNGVHHYLGESADGGRDGWRRAIDVVESLEPRYVVASQKDRNLDDDPVRILAHTRRYLDDADLLLAEETTAVEFFHTMIGRHPERRFGATTLWAGASALYANIADAKQDSLAGWFATV
jgi:glyoxylase-like metal-dependent hydrolase (beta-lactamase superfamily II)